MKNNKNATQEKIFKETIKDTMQWIKQPKAYVINKKQEEKVYDVQRKMQEILDEALIETTVKIKPCPLGLGAVTVQFEADSLIVRNMGKFNEAIKEFDNFEIYATSKGIKFAGVISNVATIHYCNK